MTNGKCEAWNSVNLKKQGNVYLDLLKVCLEAPNCESFETWGFTDKYSWLKAPANALPMDKDYKKKNSYYWMRDLLKNWSRDDPAVIERNKRIAKEAQHKLASSAETTTEEKVELATDEESAKNMYLY